MNKVFYCIILAASCALGDITILQQIGWSGATGTVIVVVSCIFAGIVAILLLYYLVQHFRQKQAHIELAQNLFAETCDRLGLSANEVARVRRLLKYENLAEPQIIFQSISLYEKCVDREIRDLLKQGISPDQKRAENEQLFAIRKKAGFHHLALEHPLVSTRNLSLGQRGSLYGRNLKKPLIQNAAVLDSNEFTFVLQYNVEKEDIPYINPGDEIKFAFSRQNDSVYGVPLTVVSADGSGVIEVLHTLQLRRNQLRQFVRVDISLPLKFRLLNTVNTEKSEIQRGEVVEAKMSDISGGGISFLCERSLRAGDLISLGFDLPSAKFVGINGKVLRISLQEGKMKTFYKHHVQFAGLEPRRRDLIVKYVFDKQRQINQWR